MEEKVALTTEEAARYLGVSRTTVYRMDKQGLIVSSRTPGGQRRFSKDSVDRYLAESRHILAPQNPSKYKKSVNMVKEQTLTYNTEIDSTELDMNKTVSKPFFHMNSIRIYNDDIIQVKTIEDNTIDLIVTSPPYNVDIKYNSHDDTMSYESYLAFTKKWLEKCYKLLKNDGRFCLNIPLDKNKGGQQSVCADITTIAKAVGFKYHSTIIWNEQNISRRTAWGSWLSATAPYVIAPVEVIVVLYKNSWRKTSGTGVSDVTKAEFLEWTNGVWNFMGESKKRIGHPAPFPIELPRRCIKLFSFVGDTVLDPFMGSGTTLIASYLHNRKGIGIDIDRDYCDIAIMRLQQDAKINQPSLLK